MAIPMRLNTSGNIIIGVFIESTDGYTPATGLTSADMTINFTLMGATASGNMSTWTHTTGQLISTELAGGYYVFGLSSNPVSKVGRVRIDILGSSCIPFCEELQVLPANVYDAIVAASGTDYLLVDALQMAGVAITTDAGDNFDNFFFDNDAVSTVRISELKDFSTFTTALTVLANMVQVSSQALTTEAGANWNYFFDNNSVVSTERVSDLPTTADLVTTNSNMNVGGIGGATVATGSAQLGVNVVSLSSHAITSDAGDNFDRFWDNGGGVATEVLGDSPTTADLLTTDDEMEANMVAMSSQALTTEAGANFNNFFDNNSVVSTERISELPTTVDLFTTGSIVESNMVAMASQALTTDAGANFSTYFDNGGVPATAQIGAQSTFGMLDTVDGMTVLEYMQYSQAYITGDFKVTGAATNQIVYDKFGGTTFFSHTLTTVARTFTSN